VAAHQEVLTRDIERTPMCARIAREAITAALSGDSRCDSMELIASELVTNAYVHGSGRILLHVNSTAETLTIAVSCDTDLVEFNVNSTLVTPDAEGGRGLALVRESSTNVGYEIAGQRLTVWAELSTDNLG